MPDRDLPVLFFGGTFNPPHLGHVQLIRYVLERVPAEPVYIVPAFVPPHKESDGALDFTDRLAMCRMIFSGQNLFEKPSLESSPVEVSDLESRLPAPSYTYRSLRFLTEKHPGKKIYVLIGMDMFVHLNSWKNYDELRKNYHFIILKRKDMPDAPSGGVLEGDMLLDNPHWNVSSEEIRQLIGRYYNLLDKPGLAPAASNSESPESLQCQIEEFITPSIFQFIIENNFYRA